jgi:hypothetical protein
MSQRVGAAAPAVHGAGQHGLAGVGAVPLVPETGDAEHATVGGVDEIRLPAVGHRHQFEVAPAMMQRLRLNADRNIGFSATLSPRALKVEASLAVFFHYDGIRPQRIDTRPVR